MALNPHGMGPTSTSNIYKVIDDVHMQWMRIWIRNHAVTTSLVCTDFGSQLKSEVTAGHNMIPMYSG